MRFSLRMTAWSLRYGLTQLLVLCLVTAVTVAVVGLAAVLLASLAARIAPTAADREADTDLVASARRLLRDDTEDRATSRNATAERLESIAAEAGIRLAPADALDEPQPAGEAEKVFAAVCNELLDICRLEPGAVDLARYPHYREWRHRHLPLIEESIEVILGGDPPSWGYDPDRGGAPTSADLEGHLWWHRVLVADAAIAATHGDDDTAARALDASWRLQQALPSSPWPDALRTAVAVLELQMAALRRCRTPAGEWPVRLAALDPRRDAVASFALDVRRARHRVDLERWPALYKLVAGPAVRIAVTHSRRAALTSIARLEKTNLAAFDPDLFAAEIIESVPRWDTLTRATLPRRWDWWPLSVHATLAADLTTRVLAARGFDRPGDLAEHSDVATPHASRIEGFTWRYEVDEHGLSIALDPDVFAPDEGFPLREFVALDTRPPRPV